MPGKDGFEKSNERKSTKKKKKIKSKKCRYVFQLCCDFYLAIVYVGTNENSLIEIIMKKKKED